MVYEFDLGKHLLVFIIILINASNCGANFQLNVTKCNFELNQSKYSECPDGIFIPFWGKKSDSIGKRWARSGVWFICMLYMFMGISIVSDKFMDAIEVITSKEKSVKVKDENGGFKTVKLQIWNKTIANLTLMALGSSAPEILLAIIELIGHNFEFKELGPSTIVGSAAFNLCIITAVCVSVIPDGSIKRIDNFMVFIVTSAASILAYVWLYAIISVFSKGVVELWEALLTFLFFPSLAIIAYFAESKFSLCTRSIYKVQLENKGKSHPYLMRTGNSAESDLEKSMEIIQIIRKTYPQATYEQQLEMAKMQLKLSRSRSHAYYVRKGIRQCILCKVPRNASINSHTIAEEIYSDKQIIEFDPTMYHIPENAGTVYVCVKRTGGNLKVPVLIHCQTYSMTAKEFKSYIPIDGDFVMKSNSDKVAFGITIVDDDIYTQDETFKVVLSDIRLITNIDTLQHISAPEEKYAFENDTAYVNILDDDHPGVFNFSKSVYNFNEDSKYAEILVQRDKGCRGCVLLPYQTIARSAIEHVNFEPEKGLLKFDNEEFLKSIVINIVNTDSFDIDVYFLLQLGIPIFENDAESETSDEMSFDSILTEPDETEDVPIDTELIRTQEAFNKSVPLARRKSSRYCRIEDPAIGRKNVAKIKLIPSELLKEAIKGMLKTAHSDFEGSSSWRQQFASAFKVSPDSEDEDKEDNPSDNVVVKQIHCKHYLMHYITFIWKLLFAFIPPSEILGGYACFVGAICFIGLLTTVVGDLATHFGCGINLSEVVTAITWVALGTSLPDTFASKIAAIQDPSADSSIGNITGSNAVNVFLGVGISWTIGAIYHEIKGTKFLVKEGDLKFSVSVFSPIALVIILILIIRRFYPSIKAELGGPKILKWATSALCVLLWFVFITLCSLRVYCIM